jgi:aryl-alcohol dehydrogenase-like predicted oxidoreductase
VRPVDRSHAGIESASVADRFQQDALHQNLAIVGRVRDIAERLEATPAQVAFAWITAEGQSVIPIPGTKTPKYLSQNAGAGQLILDPGILSELDGLAPVGNRY